jgi:hypothetical protein
VMMTPLMSKKVIVISETGAPSSASMGSPFQDTFLCISQDISDRALLRLHLGHEAGRTAQHGHTETRLIASFREWNPDLSDVQLVP